eukprot:4795058-Alexandrium_andersonii.AAC.1
MATWATLSRASPASPQPARQPHNSGSETSTVDPQREQGGEQREGRSAKSGAVAWGGALEPTQDQPPT